MIDYSQVETGGQEEKKTAQLNAKLITNKWLNYMCITWGNALCFMLSYLL